MKMNAITGILLVILVGCGIWLVDTMAQQRKDQDCVLSGGKNCMPIEVLPSNR